jgi:diacylglycerol O-acyltransferase / wax synthase
MSDAEGLMWRAEVDPFLSSTFASVSVLDRKPDMARLMRRLERAAHVNPRLHQRVQSAPANVRAPSWVDDPHFDLAFHVRHVALPKPGTMRQLLDFASLVAVDPFDRTRPLWQFTVVDGLRGGRSALIQKLHHTISDGETAVRLSLEYLDFAADAPEPPPYVPSDDEAQPAPEPPNAAELLRDLVAGSIRTPIGMMRQMRGLMIDPASIPGAGSAAVDAVRGVLNQLGPNEHGRSPLWTERSLRRRVEVLRVPFRATKEAAQALGGTLNTAFITAAADAAGRYHVKLGAPVEELRTSMAVSTRTSDSGTNAFSIVRLLVPTAEMPVADRFRAITEAAELARESSGGGPSMDTLATVAITLPTSLIARLGRQASQSIDFATSNVRGSPVPVYVAGAQVLENYPIGPLAGVAYNLTLLTYNGSLDVGVNIDSAAVSEPELLRDCLVRSFADLVAITET